MVVLFVVFSVSKEVVIQMYQREVHFDLEFKCFKISKDDIKLFLDFHSIQLICSYSCLKRLVSLVVYFADILIYNMFLY